MVVVFGPFCSLCSQMSRGGVLGGVGECAAERQNCVPRQHILRYKVLIPSCCPLLSELLPSEHAVDNYQHFDGSDFSTAWSEPGDGKQKDCASPPTPVSEEERGVR